MIKNAYRIFCDKYTVYLFERRKTVFKGVTIEDMADDMYSFAIRVKDELIVPFEDIIKVQPSDDVDS